VEVALADELNGGSLWKCPLRLFSYREGRLTLIAWRPLLGPQGVTFLTERSLTSTINGKGDSTKNCIENTETPGNETYERKRSCAEECEPGLVVGDQQPMKERGRHELSEELTEFLLVKLRQLKPDAPTAGATVGACAVAERIVVVSHLALSAGVSSDAR
jgi:hypothetical protein